MTKINFDELFYDEAYRLFEQNIEPNEQFTKKEALIFAEKLKEIIDWAAEDWIENYFYQESWE